MRLSVAHPHPDIPTRVPQNPHSHQVPPNERQTGTCLHLDLKTPLTSPTTTPDPPWEAVSCTSTPGPQNIESFWGTACFYNFGFLSHSDVIDMLILSLTHTHTFLCHSTCVDTNWINLKPSLKPQNVLLDWEDSKVDFKMANNNKFLVFLELLLCHVHMRVCTDAHSTTQVCFACLNSGQLNLQFK